VAQAVRLRMAYLRVANVQRGHLDLDHIKLIEATEEEIRSLQLMPGDGCELNSKAAAMDHNQWLEQHDEMLADHDRMMADHDREMAEMRASQTRLETSQGKHEANLDKTESILRRAVRLGVREARNQRKRHQELETLLKAFLERGGNGKH
jgi:hypothetical protein